jgi:hypothetical protein
VISIGSQRIEVRSDIRYLGSYVETGTDVIVRFTSTQSKRIAIADDGSTEQLIEALRTFDEALSESEVRRLIASMDGRTLLLWNAGQKRWEVQRSVDGESRRLAIGTTRSLWLCFLNVLLLWITFGSIPAGLLKVTGALLRRADIRSDANACPECGCHIHWGFRCPECGSELTDVPGP